jgi:hypothetical protein
MVHMEANTQKFVIKSELFGAVGTLWAGTPSSISPFRYGKVQSPGTVEKQVLAKAGICDASGQILPTIRPALDILGTASGFTRMYLSGGQPPSECIVYFAPGKEPVSLLNNAGDMQIGFPAAAKEFVEMAAQAIGTSIYRSVPFNATMSHDEAIVLAGMIDLQRKQNLRSVADEHVSSAVSSDISVLGKIPSGKSDNPQWLCNVLMELLSENEAIPEDRLNSAVESLVGKGYAMKKDSSYQLSGTLLTLAGRMLIFDTALTLTSGYLGKSGSLDVAGFTCLQAGIHDILIIDAAKDSVTLQTSSAAGVLDNVHTYLTDAQKLESLGAPVTGSVPPARTFCPQCGEHVQPGKKFCPHCGANIT